VAIFSGNGNVGVGQSLTGAQVAAQVNLFSAQTGVTASINTSTANRHEECLSRRDILGAMASIWVDADACPGVIKEILFRAAKRTGVDVTLVANQALQVPRIPSVRAVQVSAGFDVADAEIVKRIIAGDLVVTADIPLAADAIAKGAEALNPRGERYSPDTIRGVLAMRDFMDTMRSSGVVGGGPPPLTQANRNAFAAQLDTWLAKRPIQ
jgi:uncharacterized protein YaiI (UPF0178 family)